MKRQAFLYFKDGMELTKAGVSIKAFDRRRRLVGWIVINATGISIYPKHKKYARLNANWERLFEIVRKQLERKRGSA